MVDAHRTVNSNQCEVDRPSGRETVSVTDLRRLADFDAQIGVDITRIITTYLRMRQTRFRGNADSHHRSHYFVSGDRLSIHRPKSLLFFQLVSVGAYSKNLGGRSSAASNQILQYKAWASRNSSTLPSGMACNTSHTSLRPGTVDRPCDTPMGRPPRRPPITVGVPKSSAWNASVNPVRGAREQYRGFVAFVTSKSFSHGPQVSRNRWNCPCFVAFSSPPHRTPPTSREHFPAIPARSREIGH